MPLFTSCAPAEGIVVDGLSFAESTHGLLALEATQFKRTKYAPGAPSFSQTRPQPARSSFPMEPGDRGVTSLDPNRAYHNLQKLQR